MNEDNKISDLEKRVLKIESQNDIRLLIAAYARAGDCHNDPVQMTHFFTEDAVWNAQGFGHYEGRENIIDGLAHIGKSQMAWTLHFPRIRL